MNQLQFNTNTLLKISGTALIGFSGLSLIYIGDVLREWTQLYGKTYGYYEGHLPILVTSDCDIIQEVFIKQFANFSARKILLVDPNEFYPLRFKDSEKINQCAYMPFGIGPRICIGMKFALAEIKLVLAKTLLNYNIEPSSQTPENLEIVEGFPIRKPKNPIPVLLKKRSN